MGKEIFFKKDLPTVMGNIQAAQPDNTIDGDLLIIEANKLMKIADQSEGMVGVSPAFVIALKNLIAQEANKAVLKALREDRLANAKFWKDKIDRMFDGEIATYKNILTADKEQADEQ